LKRDESISSSSPPSTDEGGLLCDIIAAGALLGCSIVALLLREAADAARMKVARDDAA